MVVNNWCEFFFEKIAMNRPKGYTARMRKGIPLLVLLMVVTALVLLFVFFKREGKTPQLPRENFNAHASARPELDVLETPGFWEQTNEVITPDGQTNHTTAVSYATWGLKGHHLLVESEVKAGDNMKHNLVVKHFNELAPTNQYQSVWFQDDGLVQGFAGNWRAKQGRLDWGLIYPGDIPGLEFTMTETFPKPTEKVFTYHITEQGKPISNGRSTAKFIGETIPQPPRAFPPVPEMTRLGRAGIWEELQIIKHANGDINLKGQSRMRWTRSGRCLINEGVVYTEERPEYFLWVKTWDAVEKLYRYAYFFEDGPVHHFVGEWNPQAKSIHWRSIQPPGAIEITEFVQEATERSWTFTVQDGSNRTRGSGTSKFISK